MGKEKMKSEKNANFCIGDLYLPAHTDKPVENEDVWERKGDREKREQDKGAGHLLVRVSRESDSFIFRFLNFQSVLGHVSHFFVLSRTHFYYFINSKSQCFDLSALGLLK